jgi:hypothetical protein
VLYAGISFVLNDTRAIAQLQKKLAEEWVSGVGQQLE